LLSAFFGPSELFELLAGAEPDPLDSADLALDLLSDFSDGELPEDLPEESFEGEL